MQLRSVDIGGGIVRRAFEMEGKKIPAGTTLTGDAIRAMRNHKTMIEGGRLDVWPRGGSAEPGTLFVVHQGRGKYDVIEGRKLNSAPLTKDEAAALAAPKH